MTTYKGFDIDMLSEEVNDKMDRDGSNYEGEVLELWGGVKTQISNTPVYADDNVLYLITEGSHGVHSDYIVNYQLPSAENNYSWFREYASGWVEQGGEITQSGSTSFSTTILLSIEMSDTHYVLNFIGGADQNTSAGDHSAIQYNATSITTNSVGVYVGNNSASFTTIKWEVKGVKATS